MPHVMQVHDDQWAFYQQEFGVANPADEIRHRVLWPDIVARQVARATRQSTTPPPGEEPSDEDKRYYFTDIVTDEPGTYWITERPTDCSLRSCRNDLPVGSLVWLVTLRGRRTGAVFCTQHIPDDRHGYVQRPHLRDAVGRPRAV